MKKLRTVLVNPISFFSIQQLNPLSKWNLFNADIFTIMRFLLLYLYSHYRRELNLTDQCWRGWVMVSFVISRKKATFKKFSLPLYYVCCSGCSKICRGRRIRVPNILLFGKSCSQFMKKYEWIYNFVKSRKLLNCWMGVILQNVSSELLWNKN